MAKDVDGGSSTLGSVSIDQIR